MTLPSSREARMGKKLFKIKISWVHKFLFQIIFCHISAAKSMRHTYRLLRCFIIHFPAKTSSMNVSSSQPRSHPPQSRFYTSSSHVLERPGAASRARPRNFSHISGGRAARGGTFFATCVSDTRNARLAWKSRGGDGGGRGERRR